MRILFITFFCSMSMLLSGQGQIIDNYIFGHSLIDHRPPAIPTPSDETTVPHWIFLLAEHAGHEYAAGGQYGFLPQHQNTPPISQWGYDIVPSVWESDDETFDQTDINTIFITAGNFIQYQPPSAAYYNDPLTSPISATVKIIDFVGDRSIYIYENWPDMAGFIAGELFPPSQEEFTNYNEYTEGEFHNWWIEYHDALIAMRPTNNIKMIPVGPILSLLTKDVLSDIDIEELYEDNAPHGRPNIYFLASLISYMSIYEEKAPADFTIPDILSPAILEHYNEIVDQIWNYLLDFNLPDGSSRVFNAELNSLFEAPSDAVWTLSPSPAHDFLKINSTVDFSQVHIHNILGRQVYSEVISDIDRIDIMNLDAGIYSLTLSHGNQNLGTVSFIKQ